MFTVEGWPLMRPPMICRRFFVCIACLAATVAADGRAMAGPSPLRVASTMVCADQYVLAMVPAENIIGISFLGHDPSVSALASRGRSVATLRPDAETYVMTHADIVLGAEHGDTKTLAMLQRLGVGVLRVPSRNSFPEILKQLSVVGARLGTEDMSRGLSDDAGRRLAEVEAGSHGTPVLAAFYRADGGSAATGTYIDEEMTAAGYRSLASELGQAGWGRLDLETLVMHPPAAIITASFNLRGQRVESRFHQHPVFRAMQAGLPSIVIPGALTACGNWTLVDGVEYLAAARRTEGRP